ncbi:MAG: nitrophenyl compound nitroreductase subunit ArsF family protein [Gemmataceae bacterium]
MVLRTSLTMTLLAFVAVSLAVAVADVAGLRGTTPTESESSTPAPLIGDRLAVYYFHTHTRCVTCRAIEEHAHEAVAPEIQAGILDWHVVNYEDPVHRHFATKFKLLCPSVVLVRYRDGEAVAWKNLERVWELNEERSGSIDYVRAELATFREVKP